MQTVLIPGTNLRTSRFIFGTASLFNVGLRRRRLNLLSAAIEAGFTHFDTAPYYGFGWAERDLGAVLRAHPQVTVTTKVGIYSRGGEHQSQLSVLMRKIIGRGIGNLSRPTIDFTLSRAKRSLAESLGRLGRDSIDVYMLHEPEIGLLETDEWQRWLEDEVRRGRIATFGLALTADRLLPFLARAPELLQVVQVLDSLETREADVLPAHGRPLQITYGYVSAARSGGSPLPVANILRRALERNSAGAIVVSTTRSERLSQYRKILESAA